MKKGKLYNNIQEAYNSLMERIDKEFSYFYTNPPKSVPLIDKMELFHMGELNGETYSNPLVINLTLNEPKMLSEAEYATYPIYTTIKYVSEALTIPMKYFRVIDKNNVAQAIGVIIPDRKGLKDKVTKAMHLCGYYVSWANNVEEDKRFINIRFEPKYIDNANDTVRKNKVLYHISPLPYKERIMRRGFIPKSGNSVFNYPDRTYFFLGLMGKKTVKEWIPIFKSKNKKYGDKPYTLYTIEVSKIPTNVTFYLDPNLKGGVYTMDNISPSAIGLVEDFDN